VKTLVRYGYVPLLLIGVNGTAIWLVSSGAAKAALAALLGGTIVLSFACERYLPYETDWNQPRGDVLRDWLHAVVNAGANFSTLLLLPLLTGLIGIDGVWPDSFPFVAQVLLAIVVADIGISLAHFWSHRFDALWRFHAVHHSVKRMYGFNGLMKHPVHQAIETVVGTTPLVVMGLPSSVALALVFCVAVQLLLQHSNVDYRVGPFSYLLAVSEVHRFHHQKEASLGDVNFGLFTTFVDHLLGTFYYDGQREGFTSDELGIGAEPNYPTDYVSQLVEPFCVRGAEAALDSAP
jgi:sterol desaturase/sphingolipid hydroxylase (fatty acid hydroxylase superfamily)